MGHGLARYLPEILLHLCVGIERNSQRCLQRRDARSVLVFAASCLAGRREIIPCLENLLCRLERTRKLGNLSLQSLDFFIPALGARDAPAALCYLRGRRRAGLALGRHQHLQLCIGRLSLLKLQQSRIARGLQSLPVRRQLRNLRFELLRIRVPCRGLCFFPQLFFGGFKL